MSPQPRSRRSIGVRTAIYSAALLAAAGVLVSWALHGRQAVASPTTLVIFVMFVALGDLLEIPLERRAPFSLALGPALAFGLIRCGSGGNVSSGSCDPLTLPHVGEILLVFLLGAAGAALLRSARREDLRLPRMATGALVVIAGASAYRLVLWPAPKLWLFGPPKMSILGLGAVLLVVLILDIGLQVALSLAVERGSIKRELRDQTRATAPLLISTASVGALLALAYPAFGVWTFPLFLAPLSATQFSFKQVASIRSNYLQTIRALSKVPEMAGYTVRGHSSRVARLAVEVATEMGVGAGELHEIEYAALLHDIGRISLPDPGEATSGSSGLELALVGAEIVENTGHFPRVAQMVRQQHEPYRRRGEDANRSLDVGAKIIRVASAFDDLTEPGGPGRTAWDALEKMHLGMAYDYDPQVIQALTRVLETRTAV
jgi:putative nucleotidyltransferase with HDIG domain